MKKIYVHTYKKQFFVQISMNFDRRKIKNRATLAIKPNTALLALDKFNQANKNKTRPPDEHNTNKSDFL